MATDRLLVKAMTDTTDTTDTADGIERPNDCNCDPGDALPCFACFLEDLPAPAEVDND